MNPTLYYGVSGLPGPIIKATGFSGTFPSYFVTIGTGYTNCNDVP
jgi:hypothetical protein